MLPALDGEMLTIALAVAIHAVQPEPVASPCLHYSPDTVRVTGKLVRRTFYGAPGYGDDPKRDEKETGFYLELGAPICMTAGDDDIDVAKTGIRLVQILLDQRGYDRLRPSVGRRVTLRGTLSGAITGHHHAPVLLDPVLPVHPERDRE